MFVCGVLKLIKSHTIGLCAVGCSRRIRICRMLHPSYFCLFLHIKTFTARVLRLARQNWTDKLIHAN